MASCRMTGDQLSMSVTKITAVYVVIIVSRRTGISLLYDIYQVSRLENDICKQGARDQIVEQSTYIPGY